MVNVLLFNDERRKLPEFPRSCDDVVVLVVDKENYLNSQGRVSDRCCFLRRTRGSNLTIAAQSLPDTQEPGVR